MKPEKLEEFKLHLAELFKYLQTELKLKSIPKVILNSDQKNADKILGKTGYYEPKKKEIYLFTTDRHPKDILRSFSHEVVHHWQHEHEQLAKHVDTNGESDPKYAQNNPWLRQMEKQAYLLGNIMFRDWEDEKKNSGRVSGKKNV
jgi:Zn-dependent peptidase ImmA (M78 family)